MHTISTQPTSTSFVSPSFEQANRWAEYPDREYVVIEDLEDLDPFFLNIVGSTDHWLFCSSTGALTAGRRSPETALFPYYTVDKIIDSWNTTGPWTGLVCNGQFWNPFRPLIAHLSTVKRRIMKSLLGDEVVFEEFHTDLDLRFSYRWQLSGKYGFVRKACLTNESNLTRSVRLVDGLKNILPSGVDNRMQLQYSCLADAYKLSELDCDGALMIHRLSSGIIDAPIPLECLRATTVWSHGLGAGTTYIDSQTAEKFLHATAAPATSNQIRAKRGAMFLARERSLNPGESINWIMVAEIEQNQAKVSSLKLALANPENLVAAVEADIQQDQNRLRSLVAAADGFQQTADRDTALYHYQNTLCNILRGGLPENGDTFKRHQFLNYLAIHNQPLAETHADWLNQLPATLERSELLSKAAELDDPDLLRLAEEYLPIILSRRHGDPSRPWNRFDIRLKDAAGDALHFFEGNWRDIFQNWEALAWSHPDFLDGFISKFLNASTVDGFNPFRITSHGVDWEAPDEDDPWISIGYWGDHQIIYLLKLLELEAKIHPDHLASRLDTANYVFADVPYRLKSWAATLANPRDTINFDRAHHNELMARKAQIGADALLLRNTNGDITRVTLTEKLLLPAVAKLASLIPGGGIWMNTQKPEWNDANNALAGCGLSVVTSCYLYRYLGFLNELISSHRTPELSLSSAFNELVSSLAVIFSDPRWNQQSNLSSSDRFDLVKQAGTALETHRTEVYNHGPGALVRVQRDTILQFLNHAQVALKGVLEENRRADGLWHSYNILDIDHKAQTMTVDYLPLMLEGQVAILSADVLNPVEAATLLQQLEQSNLRTERHQTYLLYPDREVQTFLHSNQFETAQLESIKSLADMVSNGDSRIVVRNPEGGFRFNDSLTNGTALKAALETLGKNIASDHEAIEALYESVFSHRSFTGRSGTMFGYEGLGSVYWHMVSKLMLAVQEVTLKAINNGSDHNTVQRLITSYFSVQSGLGFRKSPKNYGAFPAEPYSHSPAHAGAQQPGLTGQVKEGILCRIGELGIDFNDGQLSFHPRLLRNAEFAGLEPGPEHDALSPGTISFTFAKTPVSYHRHEGIDHAHATITLNDGTELIAANAVLDQTLTSEITRQTGKIAKIDIEFPSHWLLS